MTNYLLAQNVELIFLPAYSSVLNPIERCWQLVKQRWMKVMGRMRYRYDVQAIEADIQLTCTQVGERLSARMLHSPDWYIARSLAGHLV